MKTLFGGHRLDPVEERENAQQKEMVGRMREEAEARLLVLEAKVQVMSRSMEEASKALGGDHK